MNGHRFEFGDFVTEEEGEFFKRALAARCRAYVRAMRASESVPSSIMLREGGGVSIHREARTSNMTSPAALCADWTRA